MRYSFREWFLKTIFKINIRHPQKLPLKLLTSTNNGDNAMTYEEAAQHLEISPTEARREIEKQGEDWQEFVDTFGVKSVYHSDDVLEWLGW
jgi:hypothetical protein